MNGRQPVYSTCGESKRLAALTFLALATKDDELGEDCMGQAIRDYVKGEGFSVFKQCVVGVKLIDDRGQTFTTLGSASTDGMQMWGEATYGR